MNNEQHKPRTQKQRILEYLKSGRKLMRLDAWDALGVVESPSRISELRADGHQIKTKMVTVMNRYGERVRVAEWTLAQSE